MNSAAFLSQVSVVSRGCLRKSLSFSRACSQSRSSNQYTPIQKTRCLASHSADSNSSTEETNEISNSESAAGQKPALSEEAQDAIFDAFESYIDDVEADAIKKLGPAERRKAERERKLAEAQREHEKRLEILSALPHELVVESPRNKCPGCGTALQSESPDRPGYLPQTVLEDRKEKVLQSLDTDENGDPIPIPVPAKPKEAICQRCYRLTHYGSIEPHLRVLTKNRASEALVVPGTPTSSPEGKSKTAELSPNKFRKVLERLRGLNAVIIYLVDIFDFHGTFITSLRDIIGTKSPVMLAVNKTDLLPRNYKASRVEGWIGHECTAMGLRQVSGIHLISSTTGFGVKTLLADSMRLAKSRNADIYVIGAANVGKSSFINQLIQMRKRDQRRGTERRGIESPRRGHKSKRGPVEGAITTSVVPGTTLDVIKIPLSGKVNLYDTPGLMIPHQLTNYLDEKELRAVLPAKNVEHVSFRMGEGKALFIGGLARLEVVSGKPFFFTCFFAPTVKLHPGRVEEADEFTRKHTGGLLTPPFSADRIDSFGEWSSKSFTAEGTGWKKASVDIVLSGLGWIAVTGPGTVQLKISVPKGVGVFTREPLMPFEIQTGVSTYTGGKAVNKKGMNKAAKNKRHARD